jgi:UDP-2,4-diacetamido-2,4,6-trideoxy-beta-L-altropyranose hydrolase
MKNIYIRADSSQTIGIGHIMRCLVLAKRYKDRDIIFGTQELNGNINHKILEAGYKLDILTSNSVDELIAQITKYKIDMLVIDHYELDYAFEQTLKEKTDIKIIALDDTYQKHHCDILLNHNIGANKDRYKDLLPSSCKVLCGESFTLLRDEFMVEYKKRPKNKNSMDIFVSIGGSDTKNITIQILKTIKKLKRKNVVVATTRANSNLKQLQKYSEDKKWIEIDIDSNTIAQHMLDSDFAIITPSVIANEAYHINIPFISIKTADNQKDIYRFLKKSGFIVLKKMNKKKLLDSINRLVRVLKQKDRIDNAKNK